MESSPDIESHQPMLDTENQRLDNNVDQRMASRAIVITPKKVNSFPAIGR